MVKYTSETIVTLSDLDHIRVRPKAYINTADAAGIVHTIWEYIGNSLDELTLIPEGKTEPVGGTIHLCLFKDRAKQTFQILMKDTGRGIPHNKVVDVFTKQHASGKFFGADSANGKVKTAYRASGGQLGMGAKVAAALSSKFRVISKNYLDNVATSLRLENGRIIETKEVPLNVESGVIALFELDIHQFFKEGLDFAEVGYLDLVALCKQLNIFNESVNFQFYVYERKIPENIWSEDIPSAIGAIGQLLASEHKQVIYDSLSVVDKGAYLFEIWRTNSDLIFADNVKKAALTSEDKLSFEVKYYATKRSSTGNPQFFLAVNNVSLIDRTGSDPVIVFMNLLREHIAKYQETPEYKEFVSGDYNFPTMLIALDIHYDGAELSGVTKTGFRDAVFAKQFTKELEELFKAKGEEYWQQLATKLSDDIKLRYAQFYDMPLKKSEGRRVFVDLNFSRNYHECKSSDNTKCELYIVEGTSAGNITKTRDNEFQAIYETKGKPTNAATYIDKIVDNRRKLLQDKVYQDLVKILNISPNTTDVSTGRFSKIIIATDADPDGYHIAALHLSNLYILNPRIIESGMVWLAKPPLYSMELGRNRFLFLRDKVALYDARVKYIYGPTLDIDVVTDAGVTHADEKLFREIIYLTKYVGERFESVAQALNVPILIVERLVYGLKYLYPTVDLNGIAKCFSSADQPGFVKIGFDRDQGALIVSVGPADYHIGLEKIGQTIVQQLLPLVKKYKCLDITYKVKSKSSKGTLQDYRPMTLMMLYVCLKNLDDKLPLPIHRYKGLGEMPSPSCFATLMNPETRAITQVTSIGDLNECYDLLGTDTSGRKRLMVGGTALSNTFVRDQVELDYSI